MGKSRKHPKTDKPEVVQPDVLNEKVEVATEEVTNEPTQDTQVDTLTESTVEKLKQGDFYRAIKEFYTETPKEVAECLERYLVILDKLVEPLPESNVHLDLIESLLKLGLSIEEGDYDSYVLDGRENVTTIEYIKLWLDKYLPLEGLEADESYVETLDKEHCPMYVSFVESCAHFPLHICRVIKLVKNYSNRSIHPLVILMYIYLSRTVKELEQVINNMLDPTVVEKLAEAQKDPSVIEKAIVELTEDMHKAIEEDRRAHAEARGDSIETIESNEIIEKTNIENKESIMNTNVNTNNVNEVVNNNVGDVSEKLTALNARAEGMQDKEKEIQAAALEFERSMDSASAKIDKIIKDTTERITEQLEEVVKEERKAEASSSSSSSSTDWVDLGLKVAGGLAIGGLVGYGIYRTYKYFTEDEVNIELEPFSTLG